MSARKKRVAQKVKTKDNKKRTGTRQAAGKRTAPKKIKNIAKKLTKKSRPRAKEPMHARKTKKLKPVVENTIIDVIDEPVPGVLRVTEIEEVSVVVPGGEEEE